MDPHCFLEKRFWSHVTKTPDGCWLWNGAKDRHGYGKFLTNSPLAHRIAYLLVKGEIPNGLELLHGCDNPPCINPDHLSPGTHKENLAEAGKKGRMGPKTRKLSQSDVDRIRQRYLAGDLAPRIAADYRIHSRHVTRLVRGDRWSRGYQPPKDFDRIALSRQPHFGENHPHHRFTEGQVREMRAKYRAGNSSLVLIAQEFNTDPTSVRRIVKGTAWSHLKVGC